MKPARPLALAVATLAAAGCLFPDLGGLTSTGGGDASPDVAGGDGGADPAVVIADVGSVSTSSGDAQQIHVVWASVTRQWWLFYVDDDTTQLKTRWSPDFVTWSDGASLALPYTNAKEGRNFSLAYADIAGVDVVHVAVSHRIADGDRRVTHTRATIDADGISFGTPADLSSLTYQDPALDPDSPRSRSTPAGESMTRRVGRSTEVAARATRTPSSRRASTSAPAGRRAFRSRTFRGSTTTSTRDRSSPRRTPAGRCSCGSPATSSPTRPACA
jgi:hypothetical protein